MHQEYFDKVKEKIDIVKKEKDKDKIRELIIDIIVDLEKFCQYLHLLKEHNVLIKRVMVGNKEAVHLMTAHKSKGLEFDYVYIVNAYDGHWGNKRKFEPIQLISSVFSISHKYSFHHKYYKYIP